MATHRQVDIESKVVQTWNSGGKWAALVLAVALLGWGAYSFLKSQELKQEADAYSALYTIEKTYLERKSNFELGEMLKTQKADDLGIPPEIAEKGKVKSGDIEKDFGDVILDLKSFAQSRKGTQAAALAGLWLMDIYASYNQWDQAGEALADLSAQTKSDSLIAGLLEMSTATALAEAGKCEEAVKHWDKILGNKAMAYLHGESALRAGLCLEKTGDFEGAAAKYRLASEKSVTGSNVASSADQFLRALEIMGPAANKEKTL